MALGELDPSVLAAEWSSLLELEGNIVAMDYAHLLHINREVLSQQFQAKALELVHEHGAILAGRAVLMHARTGHQAGTRGELDAIKAAAQITWLFTINSMAMMALGLLPRNQSLPISEGMVDRVDLDSLLDRLREDW